MSWVPRIGAEFGGYRLEALLGHGGMSIVYRAQHLSLGRTVALKLMAPELTDDEGFRERFTRESRLAASLDHPNIIPIHEAGEADGIFFIAMRFVDGPDLKKLIKEEGRLDIERSLSIVTQVATALDAAHAKGLVHRDVKPANILIAPGYGPGASDHVYLSDFGVAKHTASRALTKTGIFVGTVDYAAPEQIEGKPLDGRADIYSLGCVLYECLTGAAAYDKDSEVALMYAHLLEPPPSVSAHRPDVSPELDEVVATAMAKSRDDRYATGKDLASALLTVARAPQPAGDLTREAAAVGGETLLAPGPTGSSAQTGAASPAAPASPPPGRPDSRRRTWLFAGIALAVVVALGASLGVVLGTRGGGSETASTTTSVGATTSSSATTSGSTTTAIPTAATPATPLEQLVPGPIWADCQPESPPAPGAVQSAICEPTADSATRIHPDEWEMSTYPDGAALTKAYDAAFAAAQKKFPDLVRDKGACNSTSWGGEEAWLHGPGKPGGRRFCYFDGNDAVIVWTHAKLGAGNEEQPDHVNTLGSARVGGSAHDTLFRWWNFWHHRIGKLTT